MGKSTFLSNAALALVFNGTASATLFQNNTTSPLTNLYVALHSADPGAGGTQATNEISYTSYARVAVARTSGGWTITSNAVSPTASITFPTGTGGSGTATYWSVGVASSGATSILYSGPISPSIAVGNGITPQLTSASTVTEA